MSADGWNIELMRMQKMSLFGSVPQNYRLWAGLRGYGFGGSFGYLGHVHGFRHEVEFYLPSWLEWLGTAELWRDGERVFNRYKLKMDVIVDNFVYISLAGLEQYPDQIERWLFWEVNLLFAFR